MGWLSHNMHHSWVAHLFGSSASGQLASIIGYRMLPCHLSEDEGVSPSNVLASLACDDEASRHAVAYDAS